MLEDFSLEQKLDILSKSFQALKYKSPSFYLKIITT